MLDVAVLGTGWAGATHLNAFAKNPATNVAAVFGVPLEQAEQVAARHNCAAYDDFDKMVSQHRLDVIDICLPTFLHKEYFARCLAQDAHIVCEKPLALTHAEAEAIGDMAAGHPQKIMIAYTMRFFRPYEVAKRLIDSRKYGQVKSVFLSRLCPMPQGAPWREDAARSGGGILDLHIHDMDLAYWFLGMPERVDAVGSCVEGTDNWAQAFITFGYPQQHVVIEATQNLPQCAPYAMGYRIHFDRATLAYSYTAPEQATSDLEPRFGGDLRVYEHEADTGEPIAFEAHSPYESEIDYFVDCVVHDRPIDKGSVADAVAGLRLYELVKQALERQ